MAPLKGATLLAEAIFSDLTYPKHTHTKKRKKKERKTEKDKEKENLQSGTDF